MRILILLSSLVVPSLAYTMTETTTCTSGNTTRRIELQTEGEAQAVSGPCKVVYYKDTEAPGTSKDLWTAQTDVKFCQEKRDGFVQKLAGLGWTCTAGATAAATPESMKPSSETVSPTQDTSGTQTQAAPQQQELTPAETEQTPAAEQATPSTPEPEESTD